MRHEPEPMMAELPEVLESSVGPNLWAVVLRRKWIIVLGSAVGLVLGYLYYLQRPAVYQSDAQVLVVRKQPDVLPVQGVSVLSYFEDYMPTHMGLIRSPWIVSRAIQNGQLHSLRSFQSMPDPSGVIIGSLSIARDTRDGSVSSTNILKLSYRGPVAADCGKVLSALIDSYTDFLGETYEDVSQKTLDLITQAKDDLGQELKDRDQAYLEFRKGSPLLWSGKSGTNIHQERLGGIEAARSSLLVRRADIEGRLKSIGSALEEGGNPLAVAVIVSRSSQALAARGGGVPAPAEDPLFPLELQEKMLLEEWGPEHPKVREVRKRIDLTRDSYRRQADALKKAMEEGEQAEPGRASTIDPIKLYVESLRQELKESKDIESSLSEYFKLESDRAKLLADFEVEDDTMREGKDRTKQLYLALVKRLQEVELVKDYGGYTTRVISPAGIGMQVEPNATRIIALAGFLGVMGGFGLAYLVDLADKRFRSPEEIRRRLSLPVVGHIPLFIPKPGSEPSSGPLAERLDKILCAHHRPQSVDAEAYRGVRTALYFSTRGEGNKVIQITSPVPGDGKSTLSANLALCIAQSGKKILLVDADFRRPCQHKLFGLSSKLGLVSVLAGQAKLEDAIQQSGLPGLSILAAGPHPPNPSELLTLPEFKDAVDLVRGQYDFVLIDTPPLLEVTDPCAVAPRVDGVLLTIRVSNNVRPDAERAKEILTTLGAQILGVVVNAVAHRSGYGYRYGYSYYRKYGYRGYTYGDYGYHRKAG